MEEAGKERRGVGGTILKQTTSFFTLNHSHSTAGAEGSYFSLVRPFIDECM